MRQRGQMSQSSQQSKSNRTSFKLLTVVLVTVVCASIAYVGWVIGKSRPIYLYETGHEITGHRHIYDALYGWRNIPNTHSTTINEQLSINSKGLRCREIAYRKPAGVKRILVLGDSYTWGYGVANDEVFTSVLENRIQQENQDYEVVNAGVSGWGTDQQYLFLVNEGFKYSPDIVVVAHFINDLKEILNSRMYGLNKPIFVDRELNLANVPVPKPSSDAPRITANINPFQLTRAILSKMQSECDERSCEFVFMRFGSFIDPNDDVARSMQEHLEGELSRLKSIRYLDLDQAFARANETSQSLIGKNRDNHWNAHGHQRTAEALYEFLRSEGLIDVSSNDKTSDRPD